MGAAGGDRDRGDRVGNGQGAVTGPGQAAVQEYLQTGLTRLLAAWKQQLDFHARDANRFWDDPDQVVTYRDICAKASVYDRVISEVEGLLDPEAEPPMAGRESGP